MGNETSTINLSNIAKIAQATKTGAMMGSLVPGVGNVIGALGGALTGTISQIRQNKSGSGGGIDNPSGYPASQQSAGLTRESSTAPGMAGGGGDGRTMLGGNVGLAQIFAGIIQNRQAKRMLPSLTDPAQTAFLSDINMKRKNLGFSGADYGQGVNLVNQNLATGLNSISKVNTGSAGSVLAAMAGAQGVANQGVNQVAATQVAGRMGYDKFASDLTDQIAQRKLDLEMYSMLQKKAQATTNINAGMDNVGNAVSTFLSTQKPQ